MKENKIEAAVVLIESEAREKTELGVYNNLIPAIITEATKVMDRLIEILNEERERQREERKRT